jgi:hypothetical protein
MLSTLHLPVMLALLFYFCPVPTFVAVESGQDVMGRFLEAVLPSAFMIVLGVFSG